MAREVPFAVKRRAALRVGALGERLACRLLRELGMDVLTRHYLGPHGELDIVARDGLTLCIVEVKTYRHTTRGRPAEKLTRRKKEALVRTAARYLRQLGRPSLVYRYDLVEIVLRGRSVVEARHWPAVFSAAELGPHRDELA